jgi:hypothetical protein
MHLHSAPLRKIGRLAVGEVTIGILDGVHTVFDAENFLDVLVIQ